MNDGGHQAFANFLFGFQGVHGRAPNFLVEFDVTVVVRLQKMLLLFFQKLGKSSLLTFTAVRLSVPRIDFHRALQWAV
jgi:hypothetical protein